MKRTILILALTLGLTHLQAQEPVQIGLEQAPTFVTCGGRCALHIVRADHNGVSYHGSDAKVLRNNNDQRLALTSTSGTHFTLYLDQDTLPALFLSGAEKGDVVVSLEEVVVANLREMTGMSVTDASNLQGSTRPDAQSKQISLHAPLVNVNVESNARRSPHYSASNRFEAYFLWGFLNWGTTPINGLMGVTEPGYDIRTSFSSYQIEAAYSVVKTRHFELHVGASYGSHVYKFRDNNIELSGNALRPVDPIYPGCESRIVVRSVSLPIGMRYRTSSDGFKVDLSILPGLHVNGRRTGVKQVYRLDDKKQKDYTSLSGQLNPFVCDTRLTLQFSQVGIFLQVPTLPLFVSDEMPRLYPIKVGFTI